MTMTTQNEVLTTSDLRKPEVLEGAVTSPVIVREPHTKNLLVLCSKQVLDHHIMLEGWYATFARVVVESQRPDPSPAVLGPAGYIADWPSSDREFFVRGFADALASSQADGSSTAVEAYVDVMKHRFDPISDRAAGRFTEEEQSVLKERFGRLA